MMGIDQAADLPALERRAAALQAAADGAERDYERTVWMKFFGVFVPVPFGVLLLRLHMEGWHYYIAGALFVAVVVGVMVIDSAGVAKRAAAARAAAQARDDYGAAQAS